MNYILMLSFVGIATFVDARFDHIQESQAKEIKNDAGAKAGIRSNWRNLKVGMSQADVTNILGEPQRVSVQILTVWYYGTGNVYFDRQGSLLGWTEPS